MPSYSPVFSAPFVQYTPATPNQDFEVPAGFTAVVRQVSCVQNVGGFIFYLAIRDSLSAPLIPCLALGADGVANCAQLECRFVVPAGGFITCYVSTLGTSIYMYAGGYLLRNTLS